MDMSFLTASPSMIEVIKANYESFVLQHYRLEHAGLFHDNRMLYAVVKNPQAAGMSLAEVNELYNHQYRTLAVPGPVFVEKEDENFIKISLRTPFERINLFGQSFNTSGFNNQINKAMPPERHPFQVHISWADNRFRFTFKNAVSEAEFQDVILICEGLGYYGYAYENHTDPHLAEYDFNVEAARKPSGDLTLISGRYLKNRFPRSLVDKYEEDQDFWSENKFSVFSDVSMRREECLTDAFRNAASSCFVDATVFQRNNIREYISLYDTVIIAVPITDGPGYRNFYETFRLNRTELLELVRRGRVRFVVYQNLHRYDAEFLADVLSADPDCMLFSRRLAAASLLAIRKKTGVFGYSFDTEMQYQLQRSCWHSGIDALKILADSLSHNATYLEYSLDQEGALGLSQFGAGIFAANIYKHLGKELFIELTSSAMGFEYAQGLNAHHFPVEMAGYSEVNACRVINGIYNGVHASETKLRESEVGTLLSDVLTVSNDMNVLELDDIMTGHGRKRLPDILSRFSGLSEEARSDEVYKLNKEIKRVEKRADRVASMDISGLIPTAAGALMEYKGIPGGAYVSLLPWVLKSLGIPLRFLDGHQNAVLDKLTQLTHGASPDTLLIHRIRKDIR